MLGPIRTKSLRAHVHDRLHQAIVSGQLPAGHRLNERQLAADLEVSTSPLKEALRQLETEGLVRVEPRRGTYVTFSPRQAEEMCLARAALESVITRQAAIHGSAAQFDALRAAIEKMRAAASSADGEELIALNEQFHAAIHEASDCRYLSQLQRSQQMYDHATRITVLTDPAVRRSSFREHEAIMQAVVARDGDRAAALMHDHIIKAGIEHVARVFGTTEPGRD